MKRIYIAFAMLAIAACQIEEINDTTQGTDEFRFVAERSNTNDDTKTIRQDDGSIIWNSSEEIKVFTYNGASGKFVSTNDVPASKAEFIGSFDKKVTDDDISNGIMALYPYSDEATYSDNRITFTIPSVQTAKEGTFDTGLFPSIAYSTTTSLYFHNVCAGIRFTVSQEGIRSVTFKGNDSEALAGKVSVSVTDNSVGESVIEAKTEVTVNAPEEGYFEPGKEYYIVILAPEWPTYIFWKGITITYHKDEVSDSYVSHNALELHRSQFANINEKDKGLAFIDPAQPIEFADEIMKEMCLAAFDSNGDGELSYGEAKSVTDLSQMKLTQKTFKSFDEFQYFTNVTGIPHDYFRNCLLTSITLPNSIESIDYFAFADCLKLEHINLPDGIKHISQSAFRNCKQLSGTLIMPTNLTYLGSSAFSGCEDIKEVVLNNNIDIIDIYTFAGCLNLKAITISSSITRICNFAFSGCSSLVEMTLPEGLTEIGMSSFGDCSSLKEITLPDNLIAIGTRAFSDCSNLKSINIPENVTTIEDYTFYRCSSLETITLPENLTAIGGRAFSGCSNLKSINIPENVTTIEDYTFYDCSSLETITLPENLTAIGTWAFSDCSNLKSINIPENVTTIEDNTFYGCSSLETITLPENLTAIGGWAFYGCSNLKSINIPENVTTIEDYTFSFCDKLEYVYLKPIVPPSLGNAGWHYIIEIYVPMEALEDYKNATGWAEYADKIVGYNYSNE